MAQKDQHELPTNKTRIISWGGKDRGAEKMCQLVRKKLKVLESWTTVPLLECRLDAAAKVMVVSIMA